MMENFVSEILNARNHIIKHKWFPKKVIKTIKLKYRCFCEYKQHCNKATLIRYIQIRNKCKNTVIQAKEAFDWLERIIRLCSGSTCKENLKFQQGLAHY